MSTKKSVHVVACGVLAGDLRAAAERLGLDVSMEFLPGGLHARPHELRQRLQEAVDRASAEGRGDTIAIGYGVCGMGTAGVQARNVPLVFPRVNDCIALFLGSDAAYREQFARYPGTYYISAGWVEEKARPQSDSTAGPEKPDAERHEFGRLVQKYGRDNAEAIRYFLNSWQRTYQRAAFIDTGAGEQRRRYADIARDMAQEFGWQYEELTGTGELLEKLLTAQHSTDEVLVVPPHHVTVYDAVIRGLKAVPVWERPGEDKRRRRTLIFEDDTPPQSGERPARLGLGIDAGGTYTDAVVYDFQRHTVIQKAKALTTPWDFTIGIGEALDRLDPGPLPRVDLVSISTTLATNAIVEGRGQKAGLLVMPPYGLFDSSDITYRPIAVIDGRLEIDGAEIAPVDAEQVRRTARQMIGEHQVQAFAVAGYGGHANPSHELQVKEILGDESGLTVTCGHEVSETLNYRVRAATAALNARIIPCLETLIDHVRVALEQRGVHAPRMVVKSDGSLLSAGAARRRPIETILSGPAASVAGASYLARLPNALVVDMGGTTTDTAMIENGAVRTCEDGASVGGWRTHVEALDMRTLGLGGDSLLARQRGELRIGPRRVAPVAWVFRQSPDGGDALDWLERHLDQFGDSTRGMDLILLSGHARPASLSDEESRIVRLLSERPHSVHELAHRTGDTGWRFLPLESLERGHLIQRGGLTPTDLLHVAGRVELWNKEAARRMCDLFGRLAGVGTDELVERILGRIVRRLAIELLKKQLGDEIDLEEIETSPAAMALIRRALTDEPGEYDVRLTLRRPVVGIGAPVHCFLPEAAALLGTEAVIPPDADVANAIGAITSPVFVHKQVNISPDPAGRYSVGGLPGAPAFVDFDRAHDFAVTELVKLVRDLARQAGTSQTRVEMVARDRIGELADGGQLFLGRALEARLSGRPDLARLEPGE